MNHFTAVINPPGQLQDTLQTHVQLWGWRCPWLGPKGESAGWLGCRERAPESDTLRCNQSFI